MTRTEAVAAAPADAAEPPAATAPPPPTRLLLVRHAVTAQTGPVLSGRAPGIPLSDDGVAQAEVLAARLATLPIAAVYASPIQRTTETAVRIAARHRLDVRPLEGVLEADYGDWTGGELRELARTDTWKVVQAAPSRARFPRGESIREMQSRTVSALESVVQDHPGQTVAVVSHADPIKSAIAHFTGVHLDLFQRIHVAPASVSAFEFHAHGAMLLKCNDTGSLADLEVPPPGHGGHADAADGAESGG